ncbi:ABC transporter ATP-binding protein [Eoetvoesiella caeni]|uniref:L-leucine ABC transporter ATP-binding protein /L-isoleucine ABC transporter ATP-binding protein /L-valine ABC transporter ATP-binding protein n=1 Tax=Eoetvoesiella caeni TaxID=645616 RepID=A0A366HFP1_9BURK|nr:ABC transporter ATP-binding protein [Eoetvoesiella caeni]MCI2808789.1 ABC transporter ATP-binding protein [Eoetvoesiella caeni]NYT55329.1 ABC transporter ATP-binding protein [Eoetvoesiella caeni]RBP40689.1 L-leucine ABC transporter ATP-binding protein /L-isoleucine ABC transporter ATP-binding protein /L-valine ABC transporter ATP-binding protein [Eoetvoesiella caeni]
MLRLENICTHYGGIQALDGVSVEVNRGEIVALIGANGAGKTTLLMTICGTPQASAGRILFQGDDITAQTTAGIMRRGIALVPEGRRVFANMTVAENLNIGGYFLNRTQLSEGLAKVHELFPRLLERARQQAGTLSGGEQQMLAIGRALMSRPRLLLLDEPTLGLAPLVIRQIFEAIGAIRDTGVTVLLVEQNASKALQLADRAYVLESGRIVLAGSGAGLLANEAVKRAYLGGQDQPSAPARPAQ